MEATDMTIMTRLREETRPMHDEAESSPLEREMGKGALAKEKYVENLEQRLVVHRALEAALRAARPLHAAVAGVVDDYQFKEEHLVKDLVFFGRDPQAPQAVASASAMVAWIEETAKASPVALLGIHYVFEGSTNGARFLAKGVRKAYGLEGVEGTAYLDPYGDEQRALWTQFKERMAGQALSGAEADAIVEAAKETFRFVGRIEREVWEGRVKGEE